MVLIQIPLWIIKKVMKLFLYRSEAGSGNCKRLQSAHERFSVERPAVRHRTRSNSKLTCGDLRASEENSKHQVPDHESFAFGRGHLSRSQLTDVESFGHQTSDAHSVRRF